MPVYLGSNKIGGIFRGSSEIKNGYVGSTLVYQNVTIDPHLMTAGAEVSPDLTGGISNHFNGASSDWYFRGTYNSTGYRRFANGVTSARRRGSFYFNNPVNLSGWSSLKMTVRQVNGYGDATKTRGYTYIGLMTTLNADIGVEGGNYDDGLFAVQMHNSSTATDYTLTVDISNVSGPFYIVAGFEKRNGNNGTHNAYYYDIYLE